ncbi:MAG TPA: hypothetical protein VLH15_00675 [Dehalococcoidales bacterium]|nr:hypothetical protein [Dehalococcoidales bacterium]
MKSILQKNKIWVILFLAAIAATVAGFFIPTGKGKYDFWWTYIPVFYALLGIFGCIVMIYAAKGLKHWLHRKDDYYD